MREHFGQVRVMLDGATVAVDEEYYTLPLYANLNRVSIVSNFRTISNGAFKLNARPSIRPVDCLVVNVFVLVLPLLEFDRIAIFIVDILDAYFSCYLADYDSFTSILLVGHSVFVGGIQPLDMCQINIQLIGWLLILVGTQLYHFLEV